ncbi:hypothetical protein CWI37_1511p0010, partial [Hamiltosporidium tvaerminnensis]
VLKKTVETISFDTRRGLEASTGVIMRAGMYEEPKSPLKEVKRDEYGIKTENRKNNTSLISLRGTTFEKPTKKTRRVGFRRRNDSGKRGSSNCRFQEILDNEYAEIRVDTRIKTDVKIRNNRPDIFVLDKRRNKITLIEVGITSQDSLQIVETEKLRKYDLLANELGLIYKCSVEIIPYVITWDGIVTKYHKTYLKRLQIPINVEAY